MRLFGRGGINFTGLCVMAAVGTVSGYYIFDEPLRRATQDLKAQREKESAAKLEEQTPSPPPADPKK
jgi:hypothetical protein